MIFKRAVIYIIICVAGYMGLSYSQAQETPGGDTTTTTTNSGTNDRVVTGDPEAADMGIDSAQQKLKEVTITKFEDAGFWWVTMPGDQGNTILRRFEGAPAEKEPVPDEETIGIDPGKYVLGVKVKFYRRGMSRFAILPSRPLPVPGICKTISLWVVGRNTNHTLKLLISDYYGMRKEITVGKLNFTGWRKMTVAVPPHIKQDDYHYGNKNGIKIYGFRIDCDPVEATGVYYIYFDDLRVVTDLFTEENRDKDDMNDGIW